MRIFLTGATGFIGSRIVPELIDAGHQVLGLTRSDAREQALRTAGAEPHRGDIEDLESLRRGASVCDAVIHTAFDHDFAHFVENCQKDARVIEALGSTLEGSARPLIITSGTGMGSRAPGQPAIEDHFDPAHANPRVASERAGEALLQRGVNVSVVRLSQIHDTVKQGLITPVIELARAKGVSAYVGEGRNAWSATHVTDTARLYRLALQRNVTGARYNATAEESIEYRLIAQAIGDRLGLPVVSVPLEQAPAHFGWLSMFIDKDMTVDSSKTRERLNWQPTGPGLLEDLARLAI
ncbi:SDR family oxidoreductase [soil metagenome]